LNERQREAAWTLDRHVSVTAGPGAGKTTVLVERYLEILRTRDVTVDQIVAITFTNRAANEMRERLRRQLDLIMRTAPIYERAAWLRHKRTLDAGVITTIHGFCARLLREFPLEAGVDPQFALLDEHQSAILIESVIEETLTEFITQGREAVSRLAAGSGRARLVEALVELYRQIRNQGLSPGLVRQATIENHAAPEEYSPLFAELDRTMRDFIGMRGLNPEAERKRRSAEQLWPELAPVLAEVRESGSLADYCQAIDDLQRECRPARRRPTAGIAEQLDRLLFAFQDEQRKGPGLAPQVCFDQFARRNALDLIDALEQVEQRLDEEKRRLAALDFDDLQVRAVKLLDRHPEVLKRATTRYRFYLVDEFQDTNGLQRELLRKLALEQPSKSNLFIVGDRKQSIYGFRGADVDVFREMTSALESVGGRPVSLDVNFRSGPDLVGFFNLVFERIFNAVSVTGEPLEELGYVQHEGGVSARKAGNEEPAVELLVDLREGASGDQDDLDRRELDAAQIARRIRAIHEAGQAAKGSGEADEARANVRKRVEYRDIAILFRALTGIGVYESALRLAGIPYFTVQGKGFYEREEVNDLIQLVRFLDNTTDEIALASVLRSPLGGLSDETLLALRCAPASDNDFPPALRLRRGVRDLYQALIHHRSIEQIAEGQREALDRVSGMLEDLVRLRNRLGLSELLRRAVSISDYETVIAANFDGAQRLANVEKLFVLAERFDDSGETLIRDFVRFVHDFELAGGREGEGQIDESADAVRLMTVHQSKGLEFPIVIIAEMHRRRDAQRDWYMLDRHRGLTVKVPDGRGGDVAGKTMMRLRRRDDLREEFESARLLYVAATRAQERLILSGATRDLQKQSSQTWLGAVLGALDFPTGGESRILKTANGVRVMLSINLADEAQPVTLRTGITGSWDRSFDPSGPAESIFPLLSPIHSRGENAIRRFSVSQLVNYRRCPRQYYFDRILHAPSSEEIDWWNEAEAPEPPANLTAALRGAVIHRFCEKYDDDQNAGDCLATSLDEVLRYRQGQLGERIAEVDRDRAIADLTPLADNYLSSGVRRRIETTLKAGWASLDALEEAAGMPGGSHSEKRSRGASERVPSLLGATGVSSEQRFRLRRPRGILTGTIDKILVSRDAEGSLSAEIVDFKTNRFRVPTSLLRVGETAGPRVSRGATRRRDGGTSQLMFEFGEPASDSLLVRSEVETVAADYRLQMQAYALAIRELAPQIARVRVTLHFLDPNLEVTLGDELLEAGACARAVDGAADAMFSSASAESFPVNPAVHCRTCAFLRLCPSGRQALNQG
jgi:ATP-dependent helicase/nuclease subunit A